MPVNEIENLTLTGSSVINGTGNSLNNLLLGDSANNVLTGNAGNNTLDGTAGSDTLIGGAGNDTSTFGRGYGAELVRDTDTSAGNADLMQFLSGVSREQIWFRRVSNHLEVSVIGGTDAATIENWYLGTQHRVEQFRTSTGQALMESQLQNLVNAMAAFSPPAAGQTTLPASYQTALQPVLAANWTACAACRGEGRPGRRPCRLENSCLQLETGHTPRWVPGAARDLQAHGLKSKVAAWNANS